MSSLVYWVFSTLFHVKLLASEFACTFISGVHIFVDALFTKLVPTTIRVGTNF